MGALISLLTPVSDFVRTNLYKIVVALAVISSTALAFYATLTSLKKLKIDVFAYYPFDRFFPQSGPWSVGYFLIIILFLGLLIYLLARGGFYLAPA